MNLSLEDITFIIVTHKSEQIINDCLKSLPKNSNKIIVENSQNFNLKKELKENYDNIEILISENLGMGATNNIGIRKCSTKYAFVLNPDVKFKNNTLEKLFENLKRIEDFAIVSPLNSNDKYPNYKIFDKNKILKNENIISVDTVDGFSMLINKEKFPDNIFFDENFFLYLENDDLCLRIKNKKENIFIIKDSLIDHKGGIGNDDKTQQLRNWHWMWSRFYFNKKHFGYTVALQKVFFSLLSSSLKYIFFTILLQKRKKKIYEMRLKGTINSILGNKAFFRI